MIGRVVRFQWHAIVAHSIRTVFAKLWITFPRYFAILTTPKGVYSVFRNGFPRFVSGSWCRRGLFNGGCRALLKCFIVDKKQVTMTVEDASKTANVMILSYLSPTFCSVLPFKLSKFFSLPRGWLDIVKVNGSAFVAVSMI